MIATEYEKAFEKRMQTALAEQSKVKSSTPQLKTLSQVSESGTGTKNDLLASMGSTMDFIRNTEITNPSKMSNDSFTFQPSSTEVNKAWDRLFDIFFYISDSPKIKQSVGGSQFIMERYLKKSKQYVHKENSEEHHASDFSRSDSQRLSTAVEEHKVAERETEDERTLKRLKFEK